MTATAGDGAGTAGPGLRTEIEIGSRPEVWQRALGDRAILTLPGTMPLLRAAHVREVVQERRPRHVHVASYFRQPALATELPALLSWLRTSGVSTSLDTHGDPRSRWSGLDEAERLRWAAVAGALSTRGTGGTASQAAPADLVAR